MKMLALLLGVASVIVTLSTVSTTAASGAVDRKLLSKLPKLAPCFFYPGDNATAADACGTNDLYTLALQRKDIKSAIGKITYDDVVVNHECEKTLEDETGCLANSVCVWSGGICQSNPYVRSRDFSCSGSMARAYYNCLTMHTTEAACTSDLTCGWTPDLSKYNLDGLQLSCYAKEASMMNGTQFDDWYLATIGNTDAKIYTSNWGKCGTAKAYYAGLAYASGCAAAKDKDTCYVRQCEWSLPFREGRCVRNNERSFAIRLAGAGPIKQQFSQCFNPALSAKGKAACEAYTIV